MRNALRSLSIGAVAVGLVTCADVGSGTRPAVVSRATLALAPQFEPGAKQTAAALAQLGIQFDQVRIVIVRLGTIDTLKDTSIVYHNTDAPVTLQLSVLATAGDQLTATVQFRSGSTLLFEGSSNVVAAPVNAIVTADNTVTIVVTYKGPGSTATKVVVAPGSGTFASGVVTQFTAKAFDASNVQVQNAPIVWSVSDTNIATIDALTGVLTPKLARGTVKVTASLGSLTDFANVVLVPASTQLRVVQGAGQSGPPGSQLPVPIIIEADAADGLPGLGSGLTATFAATNGGSVSPTTVAFGADGRAQALFTLGTKAGGVFLYTVSAGSLATVNIVENAVVGPPTQLIAVGSTTISTTAGIAPSPLPSFRVADALGNSVPLIPLQATIQLGANTTTTPIFVVDTIGVGLLPTGPLNVAGTYTVTIFSGNAAVNLGNLVYTITITPAAPAKLGFNVQPTNVIANATITPAVKVLIQDQYGNTVTTSTASVTIGLDPATTTGETLGGTKVVSAVNGIATFSTLTMSPAKTGVKLVATSTGLTQILSVAFNVQ